MVGSFSSVLPKLSSRKILPRSRTLSSSSWVFITKTLCCRGRLRSCTLLPKTRHAPPEHQPNTSLSTNHILTSHSLRIQSMLPQFYGNVGIERRFPIEFQVQSLHVWMIFGRLRSKMQFRHSLAHFPDPDSPMQTRVNMGRSYPKKFLI